MSDAMNECKDRSCPVHGSLRTRGKQLQGKVVSTRMDRSALVKVTHIRMNQKYERYEKRASRIPAHVPDCIKLKEGQMVTVSECRPISKTKSFVVTKVMKDG